MKEVRYTKPVRAVDDIKYLTVEEQETFLERSVQPKVLQQLLGRISIKITMDRYVHVTEKSLEKAIQQFETATPTVEKKV